MAIANIQVREQASRLTNAISVYILDQSCGYMEYLRGECQ